MNIARRALVACLVLVAIVATAAALSRSTSASAGNPRHAGRVASGPNDTAEVGVGSSADIGDALAAVHQVEVYVAAVQRQQVADYLAAVQRQQVADYVAAIQAQEQRDAEAAAARRTPAAVPTAPAPSTVSGGACGGATNGADQYIQRESGGQINAENPSGAYGCYQIMPSTWASSCSDLGDEHSASGATQAACASRLPMSAWAL